MTSVFRRLSCSIDLTELTIINVFFCLMSVIVLYNLHFPVSKQQNVVLTENVTLYNVLLSAFLTGKKLIGLKPTDVFHLTTDNMENLFHVVPWSLKLSCGICQESLWIPHGILCDPDCLS